MPDVITAPPSTPLSKPFRGAQTTWWQFRQFFPLKGPSCKQRHTVSLISMSRDYRSYHCKNCDSWFASSPTPPR